MHGHSRSIHFQQHLLLGGRHQQVTLMLPSLGLLATCGVWVGVHYLPDKAVGEATPLPAILLLPERAFRRPLLRF